MIDILFEVLRFLGFLTGETILFVVTLGKRRPRRDAWDADGGVRFEMRYFTSALIGASFWIAIVTVTVLLFFRG